MTQVARAGSLDAGALTTADVIDVLTLQAGYNTAVVMIGVALLGLAAGSVGSFTVLRRRAMISDTLAHATLPGIGLAFLIATLLGLEARSLPVLLAGAMVAGLAGVAAVQIITTRTRLPEDAAMGAVLSVFFGVGTVLLSFIQTLSTGSEGGISKFIYGQTAAMSARDAVVIGVVAAACVAATLALFKELALIAFDPDFAAVQGLPVARIDLALLTLVLIVTVVGLQAVGLILIIALLIVPAAAARFWTDRLTVMVALAAIFGALSGYVGVALSALLPRFPAGGIIVLVAGAIFLLSLLLAPQRGVLAGGMRHVLLRLRIERQHVLRAVFELAERRGLPLAEPVAFHDIRAMRGWTGPWRWLVLAELRRRGHAMSTRDTLALSEAGQREAWRLTRNHRLWEAYLVSYAHLAPSHVDRSADLVEHVLGDEIAAKLEATLISSGRLPKLSRMPRSVH